MNTQLNQVISKNYNAPSAWRIVTKKAIFEADVCDYTEMAKRAGVKEGETFTAGCVIGNNFHGEQYEIYNGKAVSTSNIWAQKYNDWKRQNGAKYEKMTVAKLRSIKPQNEFERELVNRLIVYKS